MAPRKKNLRWLVTAVPALVLCLALFAVMSGTRPDRSGAGKPDAGPDWIAVDFRALEPGGTIPQWDIRRGDWALVERNGAVALQMNPEPMLEGKVVCARLLPEGGGIRARMRGERTRRAWPRFCVGLHGHIEYQFRAVAATGRLELVANDSVIASAPWQDGWRDDTAFWLELLARPAGESWQMEGRIWPDDAARPDRPSMAHTLPESPGFLYAVLQGAPLALRPILVDRLEFLPDPPRPPGPA